MMKKMVTIVTVALLMVSFASTAIAGTDLSSYDEADKIIEQANRTIDKKIKTAIKDSQKIVKDFDKGKLSYDEKELQIELLAQLLIEETNTVSSTCRQKVEDLGYYAICTWIEVELDGKTYLVDPIRIVGW